MLTFPNFRSLCECREGGVSCVCVSEAAPPPRGLPPEVRARQWQATPARYNAVFYLSPPPSSPNQYHGVAGDVHTDNIAPLMAKDVK